MLTDLDKLWILLDLMEGLLGEGRIPGHAHPPAHLEDDHPGDEHDDGQQAHPGPVHEHDVEAWGWGLKVSNVFSHGFVECKCIRLLRQQC